MKSQIPSAVRVAAMAVGVVLGLTACDDAPVAPDTSFDTLQQTLDTYLEAQQDPTRPGLAVLVRKNGAATYRRSIGIARIAQSAPINDRTGFRVASVTKPITALAVLMLRDQGLLSLDDFVRTHLPELPASFERITISHLLTHRSGVPDYIDDNTNPSALDGIRSDQLLALIPGSGLDVMQFASGTRGEYSNTGYALLALVIERVSGLTYPDFMKTRLFELVNMEDSWVIHAGERMGDPAANHAWSYGTETSVQGFESLIYGANGIVSSLQDMERLLDGLASSAFVSAETLAEMTTAHGVVQDVGAYGYGWITGDGTYWHSGFTTPGDYLHSGGFGGYRTLLLIGPSDGLEIVILTNDGDRTQETMFGIVERTRAFYNSQ